MVAAVAALTVPALSARQLSPVDEIVARNFEAKGGPKLKDIQSSKQVSTMSMQGTTASMTIYAKRPNRLRQEVSVMA